MRKLYYKLKFMYFKLKFKIQKKFYTVSPRGEYMIKYLIDRYINCTEQENNEIYESSLRPYVEKHANKISDELLLVSENEGYPVVYNEAKVLGIPILTTDVSDSKIDIDEKYGVVCSQDVEDIANKMEKLIRNKNSFIMKKFDAEEYNQKIAGDVEKIINERN